MDSFCSFCHIYVFITVTLVFCPVDLKIPNTVEKCMHCPCAVEDPPFVEDTVENPAECQTIWTKMMLALEFSFAQMSSCFQTRIILLFIFIDLNDS